MTFDFVEVVKKGIDEHLGLGLTKKTKDLYNPISGLDTAITKWEGIIGILKSISKVMETVCGLCIQYEGSDCQPFSDKEPGAQCPLWEFYEKSQCYIEGTALATSKSHLEKSIGQAYRLLAILNDFKTKEEDKDEYPKGPV